MKFAEKLSRLEHEINSNQMSKVTLSNKAKRLVATAERDSYTAKGPDNTRIAQANLEAAKALVARCN